MKVGLIYNLKGTLPNSQRVPKDLNSEYQDEQEVEAIQDALRLNGFETLLLPGNLTLQKNIQSNSIDMAFNVAEGWGGRGRESFVPALLDMLDIPFTGSDAIALGVSLDKALTKTVALANGIATPKFSKAKDLEILKELNLSFPLFVKPNCEGSSMGIGDDAFVENQKQLQKAVKSILENYRATVLIEEFMEGREFAVGILGNSTDLKILPVLEIIYPGEILYYRYENKSKHDRELRCPAEIPEDTAEDMKKMAVTIFSVLECRDFARVDFREDRQGKPYFLEINPLPGLHPENSLFPQQAYAAGLSYEELIGYIIKAAIKRYSISRQNLQDILIKK